MARWCDGGRTQRSRLSTLTDKAVKTAKRRVAESALDKVYVGNEALDNVLHFEYLGSQLQGDGEDEADVRHRMDVAQAAFGSLSHMWGDHRLSRATKLRLYRISVCSTLTHSCEAWTLTRTVVRMINGFNSRCLHAITGEVRACLGMMQMYKLPTMRRLYVTSTQMGMIANHCVQPWSHMARRFHIYSLNCRISN